MQTGYSQQCNCLSNLEWVKKTFEENDAGYKYILNKKGEVAYATHNEKFFKQAREITSKDSCSFMLYQWLRFFRKGHIGIESIASSGNNAQIDTAAIIRQYRNSDSLVVALPAFEKYLQNKKNQDYEGIWTKPGLKVGIKKVGNEYLGFVIEADGVYWRKGQIKMRINPEGSTWYNKDHSITKDTMVRMVGNNHFEIPGLTLTRISPVLPDTKEEAMAYKLLNAQKPFVEELNSNTLILRIPSFNISEKHAIDSVIAANRERILHIENLIIDIRYNGGGSDNSWAQIIPLIYTNPIREVGLQFLSTPLNNNRILSLSTSPEFAGFDEKVKQWAKRSYDTLQKHVGEFVNLDSTIVSITKFDTVYPYPKHVGIIINNENGSSAEQFLMDARQSRKVKLYGTSTFGSLDMSNVNVVNNPCNEFKLWYSMSKSYRIPDMVIDDIGLQPDFFIDSSIPWYMWVDYTSEISDPF